MEDTVRAVGSLPWAVRRIPVDRSKEWREIPGHPGYEIDRYGHVQDPDGKFMPLEGSPLGLICDIEDTRVTVSRLLRQCFPTARPVERNDYMCLQCGEVFSSLSQAGRHMGYSTGVMRGHWRHYGLARTLNSSGLKHIMISASILKTDRSGYHHVYCAACHEVYNSLVEAYSADAHANVILTDNGLTLSKDSSGQIHALLHISPRLFKQAAAGVAAHRKPKRKSIIHKPGERGVRKRWRCECHPGEVFKSSRLFALAHGMTENALNVWMQRNQRTHDHYTSPDGSVIGYFASSHDAGSSWTPTVETAEEASALWDGVTRTSSWHPQTTLTCDCHPGVKFNKVRECCDIHGVGYNRIKMRMSRARAKNLHDFTMDGVSYHFESRED